MGRSRDKREPRALRREGALLGRVSGVGGMAE